MTGKSTSEIRQKFLDFFCDRDHKIIPSSSLVPIHDSTLLFTNAGMNQFKDVFLGLETRSYSRAVSAQFCIRAGGKHNDLDNVGYTDRHHTFFEMLGNFSFGDYFKKDAIKYAWELLTSKNWFSLDKERILVTVHESDYETYDIWNEKIGIPSNRIIKKRDYKNKGSLISENFWSMGDTGPCGPCTEIFYDRGKDCSFKKKNQSQFNNRYIEIWNIVFMQFIRESGGILKKLPKYSVDTGMGLERIASILQNVNSNYKIDLFQNLISLIFKKLNFQNICVNHNLNSLYVIADHIRSSSFLISDGVFPGNEGRSYVLRRIIRRAVYHGYILGIKKAFFYKLVTPLIEAMGDIADRVKLQKNIIQNILRNEEEQFLKILDHGLNLLNKKLKEMKGNVFSGKVAFWLHDTHGFPFDITSDVCRARGIKLEKLSFELELNKQKFIGKKYSRFRNNYNDNFNWLKINPNHISFFDYHTFKVQSLVIKIFRNKKSVNILKNGEEGIIVLDKTIFYPESGGQVSDIGTIRNKNFEFVVFKSKKCFESILHIGKVVFGSISINDIVFPKIDIERRNIICSNHSATHLLHSALRRILGMQIFQKGSLVDENGLRFDFSYFKKIDFEQVCKIENTVNHQICKNYLITETVMNIKEVKKKEVISLFDAKYDGKNVRVLNMGSFSSEACCGTHVNRTGDIGYFHIKNIFKIASGIYRLEAVTGKIAVNYILNQSKVLIDVSTLMKSNVENLVEKSKILLYKMKILEKKIMDLEEKEAQLKSLTLESKAIKINGINVLIHKLDESYSKKLRIMVNFLKNRLKSTIIVLYFIKEKKFNLIVGVTKNLVTKVNACNLVKFISNQMCSKGGGRCDLAQTGGSNVEKLPIVLKSIKKWIDLNSYKNKDV